MIASTALSIGGPSPAVADNTTVVVVHRSDSNLPATPDISVFLLAHYCRLAKKAIFLSTKRMRLRDADCLLQGKPSIIFK
jgi:hypothetical protein